MALVSAGTRFKCKCKKLTVVSPSTRTRPVTGTPPRMVRETPSRFEPPTSTGTRAEKVFPAVFSTAIRK